jgi:hypothetical protein
MLIGFESSGIELGFLKEICLELKAKTEVSRAKFIGL